MKAIHVIAIIAISFIAGMFGGTFSEKVFATTNGEKKIPDQIVARSFDLVDENNVTRASFGFSADGQPVFCVADSSGKARGYLGCGPDGPTLTLLDKQSRVAINITADDSGGSTIAMVANGDKPRLGINYKPGRGPALALFDENSVGRVGIAIVDGKPGVAVNQPSGKPAVAMFYDPRRNSALLGFMNSHNQAKMTLGLMSDSPLMYMYRPDDTGLLFNIQRDGRPALGLLTNGRPEWSATGTVPQMPAMDGILDQILR